ncbi:angiotensin-converting enzyme-like [Hermetia illucens]|uniref:angiotensin-converting enzyme-like n=1 Tax=Hermetia illucens TaxID=343691 RepID=UPI0018CC16D9|nr:angiotensin-converting enzyme-like [Hermetia illucens]
MWKVLITFLIAGIQTISGQYEYVEYPNESTASTPLGVKTEAVLFLREFDREATEMCNRVSNAEWRYSVNSTDYNKRRLKEQQSVATKFACISWRRAYSANSSIPTDTTIRRQFDRILKQGHCGLSETKYQELNHVLNLIKESYNNVKVCGYRGDKSTVFSETAPYSPNDQRRAHVAPKADYCDLKLDPDIIRIMQRSRSEQELRYFWNIWRESTGPPIKNTFMRYLDIANQAARFHGFSDAGAQMRSFYDDPDFFFTVQDLWSQVQPLYKQLFTFVRKGLVKFYGDKLIRKDGPIPAHVLGNVWAQDWRNIMDLVNTGRSHIPNISDELIRQGYTPLRIFQAAEEFFTSMGLPPMLPEFWRNSLLQRPSDTFKDCSAPSSWDFCNNVDFRIKQCTEITIEDYVNAHQEVARIQYFMQYTGQPYMFRDGPNPAFHEAISQAIGLCVSGPVHLQKIGLLSAAIETASGNSIVNIEYLLSMALGQLPLMAFSLTLEKWRWDVFEKGPVNMNSRWWELNLRYMGITPPTARTNEQFDAGAKYHVISDQDYIKYFVSTILQFQIFAELCSVANHLGPLHTCDFYRSREAGRLLMDVMQKGSSVTSGQIMKILTRGKTSKLSVAPLLEYFRPLEAWLEIQNRDEPITGWNSNMEDVALYQPLHSSAKMGTEISNIIVFSFTIYIVLFCR